MIMLRIKELLNPISAHDNGGRNDSKAQTTSGVSSSGYPSQVLTDAQYRTSSISTRPILFPPPGTQGPVNFPPFEEVDDETRQIITAFNVSQFGSIATTCEHIPYNSSKKDFFSKTGRECIEAFRYTFQIPTNPAIFTVMWDYNIGLVRMTPFFKCMGYPKASTNLRREQSSISNGESNWQTRPSQMLDKNPGLRDICPSITGGAVFAQGYWMPYNCAKAICATFCYGFAAALIPLFGPEFPSQCTTPNSACFSSMTISPELIREASRKARHFYRELSRQSATGRVFPQRSPGRNVNTRTPATIAGTCRRNSQLVSGPQSPYSPAPRRRQQDNACRTDDRSFYLPLKAETNNKRSTPTSNSDVSTHAVGYLPIVSESLRRLRPKPPSNLSYETNPRSTKRRRLSSEASEDGGSHDIILRRSQSARTLLPQGRTSRGSAGNGQQAIQGQRAGPPSANAFAARGGGSRNPNKASRQTSSFCGTPGRRKSI
ncbi:hypothetical protein ED733_007235 [Metarhizium rileyi]|uniref:HTH APSES-type domain-containing protein n=1 Tax=Metarhizium rileyi (strain RCEF 4871) TaxID=1649241 RepID=A0A5C6GKB2_METRR|nr:hypothetical protein ED733_007235 [Metarhizium rileyi]